jgi:hypothetical protein
MIPFVHELITFDSYQRLHEWTTFPFKLVTLGGNKLYLGTFRTPEDVQKRRRQIESALLVHKRIRVELTSLNPPST